MTIDSKAFGRITIEDKQLIRFPVGIFGFEDLRNFALLDAQQSPFYWLQSLRDAQIAFVLINPYVFRADYLLDIPEEDVRAIGSPEADDLLVFSIVTIPDDRRMMTANLQGPIIINRKERLGRQSISLGQQWTTRHVILEELQRGA